jgi:hypothetical protein
VVEKDRQVRKFLGSLRHLRVFVEGGAGIQGHTFHVTLEAKRAVCMSTIVGSPYPLIPVITIPRTK